MHVTYNICILVAINRFNPQVVVKNSARAYHSLIGFTVLGGLKLDVKTQLRLFDTMVTPIIFYYVEMCDVNN